MLPTSVFKRVKYIGKKVVRHVIDDLESSSVDSDDFDYPDYSDEE